jgi:tRNA modification GTPase
LAFELADGLRLLDGPGDLDAPVGVDAQALQLRDELAQRVGAVLCVIDLTAPRPPVTDLPVLARVFTKADAVPVVAVAPIGADGAPQFVVSASTGLGIAALAAFLRDNVGGGPRGLSSRLHDVLQRVVEALDAALQGVAEERPEELIAVDLGAALDRLDEIHGRSSPEHLLDRIFAGFCLGK